MLSIIICTYNREPYIFNTLSRIANNDFPAEQYEIVLVNNNSTDTTEEECNRFSRQYPQVNFRYFIESAQGLSFARNRGIKEATGEILLFLDDDSFIKEKYLAHLVHQLEKHPDAMAFGGKITPLFETGIAPKWLCKWTYSWVSAINKGNQVVLFTGKSYPIGANMGFRKECIQECGDFNTQLGRTKKNLLAGEEKDLFHRVKEKNYKIYYFPDIEVEHVIPPTRTTKEYIIKMGKGVGISEQLRCRKLGKQALYVRYFSEIIKWGVSLLLWFYYGIQGKFLIGNMLILFRWHVSKGLLEKISTF